MDFKNFLSGEAEAKEFYWSLVLEPGWIQAGIWEILENKAEVISISPPTPWETDEDLIGASDTALSAAVQNLPGEGVEPSKTVFGVPPSWVSEGQIKDEYLAKIKKICSELSLSPAGFVVLPEAIAHLIKAEEGAPLNAVVLGVGRENLDVAVFKLGVLAGTAAVARSVSVAEDVLEGLTRFGEGEPLPSRFILYDGKEGELEEIRQSLLDNSWESNPKVKFLHTPKIEILEADRKVLATALAGASEIAHVSSVGRISKEDENVAPAEVPVGPEELGFVIGEDVAKEERPQEKVATPAPTALPITPGLKDELISRVAKFSQGFRSRLSGLFEKRGPSLGISGFQPRRTLILGAGFFAAFILLAGIWWWYYPKATVTVYVSPRRLEEQTAITVDARLSQSDLSKSLLATEISTVKVSGEKTKATSGTKTVGEKAKGTVKIGNSTANIINLPAGIVLVGTGDLRFTTNSTASVSAGLDSFTPGTASVDITAMDIGQQYNLSKDNTFKVGNYPKAEVSAVATQDFSGGTSRDISAVSADDLKSLESDLTDELLEKAKSNLQDSLPAGKYFIPESVITTPNTRTFSGKVGDEAANVKLTLALAVSGVYVNKDDLFNLAKEALKDKTPAGYALRNEQITLAFDLTKSKDSLYEFDVKLVANLLPEIKPDEIARKIAGKYPNVAEGYLRTIPGFTRAEIKRKPSLPGRLGSLPRVVKNITVEFSAEK